MQVDEWWFSRRRGRHKRHCDERVGCCSCCAPAAVLFVSRVWKVASVAFEMDLHSEAACVQTCVAERILTTTARAGFNACFKHFISGLPAFGQHVSPRSPRCWWRLFLAMVSQTVSKNSLRSNNLRMVRSFRFVSCRGHGRQKFRQRIPGLEQQLEQRPRCAVVGKEAHYCGSGCSDFRGGSCWDPW